MTPFEFLRPIAFWLVLPFVGVVVWCWFARGRASIWKNVCSKELLPYLLIKKGRQQWFPYLWALLTGLLLITALAGPSWELISQPLIKNQSGLIIALDLTHSMDAQDIKPSRLQRAIFKITDLLAMRKEGQTALLVFSEEAYVVTPLTDDTAAIQALLPALETKIMPSAGHRADQAIAKAAEMFKQSGIVGGSVLLITQGITPQELQRSQALADKERLTVSVLGVGTEEGSPILKPDGGFVKDEKGALVISALSKDNLMQLATSSHGSYATLSLDGRDLELLKPTFDPGIADPLKEENQQSEKRHDQGYLLVLCALPIAALFFRRGMWVVLLFLLPHGLHALTWNDLWKTDDQQGQELFDRQEYEQAEKQFQHQEWKGATSYRLGKYEDAAEIFNRDDSADGYYNYGNTQAKLGNLDAALEAYEKSLAIEPSHEDALYNKELIEELKKKQEQQQSNSQNQSQDQGDESNKDSSGKEQQSQQRDEQQQQGNENRSNEEQKQEKSSTPEKEEMKNSDEEQTESKSDSKDVSDEHEQQVQDKQEEELRQKYQEEMEKSLQNNPEELQAHNVEEETLSEDDLQRQADDRTLQRIKDDPGGLLRRKFLLQYRQQNRRQ